MIERAGQTDLQRFETYTRVSFYVLIALVALAAATSLAPTWDGGRGSAFAAVVVHGAVSLAVSARAFAEKPGSRALRVAYLALSAAALAVLVGTAEPRDVYVHGASAYVAAPLVLGLTLAVLGLTAPWRRLVGAAVAALVLVLVGFALRGLDGGGVVAIAVLGGVVAATLLPMGALTWWMLDVVRTLARTRATHARLAVAEERLRFSRDLHDVYGRSLSAIALKSELAAELARRGDARAVREMTDVRDLAQTSLADARRIVSGYRAIDPAIELAGSRSVLRSAGARLHVEGLEDALDRLDERGRTAAAWVLREATTNVLRHSDATTVRLTGRAVGDVVAIVVENDGVTARAGRPAEGTGLLGLAERLDAGGGRLRTQEHGHHYRLTATLPLVAPAAADRMNPPADPSGSGSFGSEPADPSRRPGSERADLTPGPAEPVNGASR